MPFTPEDADKHHKGLSAKSKRQWSRIAESVRKRELKAGKTEEEAAASAIKQANGVVKTKDEDTQDNKAYTIYAHTQDEYEVEIKVHQDKPFIIVPVTMMVEGVHSGSHGPILHPIDELGKFPKAWDGIPVVINHPEVNGINVSANSPDIIDSKTVGRVYNTNVKGKKLKAEIWFDEEKLNEIAPEIEEKINNNEIIEVSVGVFTDNEEEEGEWNGETYSSIAKGHRPDHLAVLTDEKGACSCADGCGIRVNNQKPKDMTTLEIQKALVKAGYSFNKIGVYSETGYREKIQAVDEVLRSLNKDNSWNYLEELYEDTLIYSVNSPDGNKLYKQSYKFESGKIEFVGDAIEVHRKVEYLVNSGMTRGNRFSNNNQKEGKMADNKCTPCVEKKVGELIANSQGRWTDTDKDFLQTLSEEQLDKMMPIVVEKEKEVQVNVLSKEDQDALAAYKAEKKAKRELTIQEIQANSSKELWPDEVLKGMNDDTLKRVSDSVRKENVADYSLNTGFSVNVSSSEVEPLYPAGIEVETKK